MKGTLTEQYGLIKNGKGHKDVFLKEAKKLFPNFIRQGATFNEASTILKQKNIINENFVGVGAINNPFEKKKKEGYETAFDNFLKEAKKKTKKSPSVKATETKVSKMVQNSQSHAYNEGDKKEPNNMIFGQIQMGYYCELKEPKNEGKTDQELLDIVYKNLAKDSIYYTKNGQFGEAGVGYTNDIPGLGEPKEPKGKYKSSGYGTLKENKHRRRKKLLKEDIDTFLNSNFDEVKGKIGNISSKFKIMGDPKVATAGLGEEGIDVSFDREYMLSLFPKDDPYNEVESMDIAGKTVYYNNYLAENNLLNEHSISMAGGIVTGGGFVGMDYMDYYGLNEDETNEATEQEVENQKNLNAELEKTAKLQKDMMEEDMNAPMHIEALLDAAEVAYEAGMTIDEIMSEIEQHLGGKMGDF